jgi:hypothetical protein
MLSLRRSSATTESRKLQSVSRKSQGNAAYVDAHSSRDGAATDLLLLGGKGPVDFRLRIAQAHARDDMAPSAWSHIGILGPRVKNLLRRTVFEIPLGARAGIGYPPMTNGVVETPLNEYDDPHLFPNVAVVRVPVPFSTVKAAIEKFRHQRAVMDALELQLAWFAFVWGVGTTGNPLLSGFGVPSAAFVEYVIAAAGYDLVPGFPSRSSCPEAIWQAARWWYEFPRAAPVSEPSAPPAPLTALAGAYDAEHYLLDPSNGRSSSPRKRARR